MPQHLEEVRKGDRVGVDRNLHHQFERLQARCTYVAYIKFNNTTDHNENATRRVALTIGK